MKTRTKQQSSEPSGEQRSPSGNYQLLIINYQLKQRIVSIKPLHLERFNEKKLTGN